MASATRTSTKGGPVLERPTLRLRVAARLAEAIEWVLRHHRLARLLYAAADVNARISALLLRGEGRECPCCGGRFRRMSRRRMSGWGGICPRCRSHPRHRAIALLLARGDLPGRRLLHFAPEPLFDPVFERLPGDRAVTADLYAPADLRLDIAQMDLPDSLLRPDPLQPRPRARPRRPRRDARAPPGADRRRPGTGARPVPARGHDLRRPLDHLAARADGRLRPAGPCSDLRH